jgi:hypothetical protein
MHPIPAGGVWSLNKDNDIAPGIQPDLKKEWCIEYDSPARRISSVDHFTTGPLNQWVNKSFEPQLLGNISKDNTPHGCSVNCAVLLQNRTAPPSFNFTANVFGLQNIVGDRIGVHDNTPQLTET